MPKEYQLTPWPRRIRIEQDKLGAQNVSVYDADTAEQLLLVMSVTITRPASIATLIQSAYTPPKPALEATEDDDLMDGFIVAKRDYPITSLRLEAGV